MLALNTDQRLIGPVTRVEFRTSMNDARIALAVAAGAPLAEIDQCTGHYELPNPPPD